MSSSISEFPPVARLCSNCQKAQFRDDVPELFQAGSHLEFDREYSPPCTEGLNGDPDLGLWGVIPTEFALMDSLPELPKLLESCQDGCDFCRFLREAITFATSKRQIISGTSYQKRDVFVTISYLWGPLREADERDVKSVYKWPIGLNTMEITVEVPRDDTSRELLCTLDCEVQSLSDSDALSQWLRLGSRAYPSYCDTESVSWMNKRLELCKEKHDHNVFDQTYIPERLVDVSSETPRLILRKDVPRSGYSSSGLKYAAISYCWGSGERQAKTTAATLHDRQAGISETEMPLVLRDAIRVTRALGIPFLWIDALCILQDDQSDWEQQCAEMHNIYGSAQLTLCVANSRSCNEGFLKPTKPRVRLSFQSHRVSDMESSFLVQLYWPRYRDSPDDSQSHLSEEIMRSPWKRRGWVFQENKLTFRKLIFGQGNLFFDCGDIQHARGKDFTSGFYLPHISATLAAKSINDIYCEWDQFVLNDYSRYDASTFSYAGDLLPALSGLARLFANRLKDVYYAGHWRRDLYRSLAWIGPPSRDQPMEPAGLIIPSWSRLTKGIAGGYGHPLDGTLDDLRSEINVQKARVVTVGSDPFGALKECRLWIRGYTFDLSRREVQLSARSDRYSIWAQWHLIVHGHCFGHVSFDLPTELDGLRKPFQSAEDLRGLKVLLLGSFREFDSSSVQEQRSVVSSIDNDQESAAEERSGEEDQMWEQSEYGCEESCNQAQKGNPETPMLCDDSRQHEISIRLGYGIIISSTGNHGEFRRVGAIFAKRRLHMCALQGDGNLEALQGLAQMETVQLV